MNLRVALATAAALCCLCHCSSQNGAAEGAGGTDGGATGSASTGGTRPPSTGPSRDNICRKARDALLLLRYWNGSYLTSALHIHKKPSTVALGSTCAAMQETCCKPVVEVMMMKVLVRPYYKQRCANATKDSLGTACWRVGRDSRKALFNIMAAGFKRLTKEINDEINATLNTTLPNDVFDDLFTYMAQFVYNSNICQLGSVVTATLQKLFDKVYHLQGGQNVTNTSAKFQACYRSQANSYLKDQNTFILKNLSALLNELRLFVNALALVEQVTQAVAGHQFPEECLRVLPSLQHCAYCGGYTSPKPCLDFCLNTMRGCFANIAALKDDFSRLSTLLATYSEYIITTKWQANTLFDTQLSQFITTASNMAKQNLITLVYSTCGYNLTSNESTPLTNSSTNRQHRMTRAVDMNSVTSVTGTGMATAVLVNSLSNDMQCVRSVENLLDTMPELLCSTGKNPLSSGANNYCWNSSNVGSYLIPPVGVSRDDQVNNPVFQLNLSVPFQYQTLQDTIRKTNDKLRIVLDCLVSDDEDCNVITNFYACVEVPYDNTTEGSGQSPYGDLETIDVVQSTSSSSPNHGKQGTSSSTNPSNMKKGDSTGTVSTPTRENVSTMPFVDVNITLDLSDITNPTIGITAPTNNTDISSQTPNSNNSSLHSPTAILMLLAMLLCKLY